MLQGSKASATPSPGILQLASQLGGPPARTPHPVCRGGGQGSARLLHALAVAGAAHEAAVLV